MSVSGGGPSRSNADGLHRIVTFDRVLLLPVFPPDVLSWLEVELQVPRRSPIGQSNDAKELADNAKKALDERLKAMEEIHGRFVYRFEHILFGPIKPDIREELLETSVWQDEISRLVGHDVDRVLQDWRGVPREQINLVLSVVENDRGELPAEVARRLKGAWEDDLNRVNRELEKAIQQ